MRVAINYTSKQISNSIDKSRNNSLNDTSDMPASQSRDTGLIPDAVEAGLNLEDILKEDLIQNNIPTPNKKLIVKSSLSTNPILNCQNIIVTNYDPTEYTFANFESIKANARAANQSKFNLARYQIPEIYDFKSCDIVTGKPINRCDGLKSAKRRSKILGDREKRKFFEEAKNNSTRLEQIWPGTSYGASLKTEENTDQESIGDLKFYCNSLGNTNSECIPTNLGFYCKCKYAFKPDGSDVFNCQALSIDELRAKEKIREPFPLVSLTCGMVFLLVFLSWLVCLVRDKMIERRTRGVQTASSI